jgi:hypothetical protein
VCKLSDGTGEDSRHVEGIEMVDEMIDALVVTQELVEDLLSRKTFRRYVRHRGKVSPCLALKWVYKVLVVFEEGVLVEEPKEAHALQEFQHFNIASTQDETAGRSEMLAENLPNYDKIGKHQWAHARDVGHVKTDQRRLFVKETRSQCRN